MNLSPELQHAIGLAHKDSEKRLHGAVAPEHLLRALLQEAEIRDLLGESGGNIPLLLATVDTWLDTDESPSKNSEEADLAKVEQEALEEEIRKAIDFNWIFLKAAQNLSETHRDGEAICLRDALVALSESEQSEVPNMLEDTGVDLEQLKELVYGGKTTGNSDLTEEDDGTATRSANPVATPVPMSDDLK